MFLFSVAAAAPQSNALFPPQCTAVLLAGLPGDVESETSYRQQLQAWLELIQTSLQVQKLFVLCDDPQSITLPPKLDGQILKADRTNFLGLGQSLAGATNSVTVIAWGHGGKQGSTPVLHVRGPRLTPGDFQTLAAQISAVQSRWVMLLRGSSSFASELAGANRQILSSERDTMFGSDPVGMNLLLKLARENPKISFVNLSEQFGRAVDAWYGERNLARTEEPTLWLEKSEPRLLAEASLEKTASRATNVASQDGPTAGDGKKVEAEPPATDLPPGWKEIKRIEAKDYPDCDAVMLRRRVSYTLGSNPAIASEQDEFVQILTAEGKRFGDFDIAYSPPFEEIEFLDCEVLSPAGKIARLDPDAIREQREEAAGDYQLGRRKFFSLPGVVPGAVLHVRYKTDWKKFPLPHVSLELPIGLELPAVQAAVEVSLPKEMPFHFALEHVSAPDPVIKQSTYGTTYSWRFDKLPAHKNETLAPPRQQPRLLISTFPDWRAFASWYERISKLTDEVTPEIAAKAAELTRAAKSDREKVVALYNYVTRLRYVAVPLGVNSVRPHAAANVLQNQFGDCKDKANLLNTLLRSLKIEAHLVLVPRFSQAHDTIPGLAFNHAISRVTLANQPIWVDTTDDVCRFGLLPPGDSGRKVLVIDGQTSTLAQLPSPEPRDHELKLHGEVSCSRPTDALPATLSAIALGYPDFEFRSAARDTKERNHLVPLLAARFKPVAGSFALDKQSATSVSALDENFSWQADGTFLGLGSLAGDKWTLRAPFWVPKEWDLALHRRQMPLFLNQGYPLTLEEEFEFSLSEKGKPIALPAVAENDAEPLRWRIEWAKGTDDKFVARFRAELARGDLSDAETAAFQKQLRQLLSAFAREAVIPLAGQPKTAARESE